MLSENIDTLRLWLEKYLETGIEVQPEAVAGICNILRACAEDARRPTIACEAFVEEALGMAAAVLVSTPSWKDFFALGGVEGLTLDVRQCASMAHYFTCLETLAKALIDHAPKPAEAPPENVLQFPTGSRRRPSTTSGGGDAA